MWIFNRSSTAAEHYAELRTLQSKITLKPESTKKLYPIKRRMHQEYYGILEQDDMFSLTNQTKQLQTIYTVDDKFEI